MLYHKINYAFKNKINKIYTIKLKIIINILIFQPNIHKNKENTHKIRISTVILYPKIFLKYTGRFIIGVC